MTSRPAALMLGLLLLQCPTTSAQVEISRLPPLLSVEMPKYPVLARIAYIEGDVIMHVETDGERVARVTVAPDAHVLLAQSAEANIRTWQFVPHIPASFQITFRYRFGNELRASAQAVTFEWGGYDASVTITGLPGGTVPMPPVTFGRGKTADTQLARSIDPSCAVAASESFDIIRNSELRTRPRDGVPWEIQAALAFPVDMLESMEVPEGLYVEIREVNFSDGPMLEVEIAWTTPDASQPFSVLAQRTAVEVQNTIVARCSSRSGL